MTSNPYYMPSVHDFTLAVVEGVEESIAEEGSRIIAQVKGHADSVLGLPQYRKMFAEVIANSLHVINSVTLNMYRENATLYNAYSVSVPLHIMRDTEMTETIKPKELLDTFTGYATRALDSSQQWQNKRIAYIATRQNLSLSLRNLLVQSFEGLHEETEYKLESLHLVDVVTSKNTTHPYEWHLVFREADIRDLM